MGLVLDLQASPDGFACAQTLWCIDHKFGADLLGHKNRWAGLLGAGRLPFKVYLGLGARKQSAGSYQKKSEFSRISSRVEF